jgi:membrane fusion protein, multidrug efflux system
MLVCPALVGCNRSNASAGAQGPQGPPVVVAAARGVDVPLYIDEIGRTTAREVVSIQPQATGRITSLSFSDGADLHKGDPLFTIDPRPYQAALDQAKGVLAQNQAQLQLARDDWKRYQSLDARSVSQSDYDAKKNAVAMDEAMVEQSQAAIETAKVNLDYCKISSPIDGRAGQRLVDLGNVVSANNGTSLLMIQRLDPIYADFTITENDLAQVRSYMAKGTLKVQVWSPADAKDRREGELTFLDNAVQDGTGTIKLRATLPNADRTFWPGQFVNVRLVLQTLKDAVIVPQTAVQIGASGSYVYAVSDKNLAEMRPVKLVQHQGNDDVVVESGVSAGDRVVTAGHMFVIPGGPVTVLPPPAATPQPGAGTESAAANSTTAPATKPS